MDLMIPDSGLLFWMVLSFAILFLVLAKFGWPIITGMAERRKERIDKSLADAAEARETIASLKQQSEALMQQAQAERSQMLSQAAQLREQLSIEAREAAQKEAQKILDQARLQVAAEKEAAMSELRSYVASLAVDVAEKILRQQLESSAKGTEYINRLIDQTLKPQA